MSVPLHFAHDIANPSARSARQPLKAELRSREGKLMIKNEDSTPEEFESRELHREKVVPPGQQILVIVGPLDAGTYPFFGDFHKDTAQGKLIAK